MQMKTRCVCVCEMQDDREVRGEEEERRRATTKLILRGGKS